MSSLDMLCNLAYVKNVSTTDFFKVELDFQSGKKDLFDIRIRLGVSRGHSVRDKSTVLNVYIFRILKAVAVQFYRKSLLKADRLHSNRLIYPVNRKDAVHNLLQPFEKLPVSQLNGLSAVYIACREMACRKRVQRCRLCK